MDLENDTFIVKTDSGELCRLCANTDNQLIPIFKGEGIEHNISSKIEKHLPIIKVTEQDKLPLQICYQCASTLIAWHNLYEGCRIADNRLREILSIDEKLPQYMKDDESLENYTDDFRDDYEEESQNNFVENVQLASISNSSQLNEVQTLGNTEINEHTDTKIFDETENENHNDERSIREQTNEKKENDKLDDLIYTCDYCAKIYKSRRDINNHISSVHRSTVFRNESSSYFSSDEIANEDLGFNFSPAVFINEMSKRNHAMNPHEIDDKCENVDDKSKIKFAQSLNEIKYYSYECTKCGKGFNRKHNLSRHEQTHTFSRELYSSCDLCGKEYASVYSVIRHKTAVHKIIHVRRDRKSTEPYKKYATYVDGKRYFKCNYCVFMSVQASKFKEHYRKHTGERPYTCDQCGKQFRVKKFLINHLKYVHEGIKKHSCDICGRCFSDKRYKEAHRRTHTGEKPYVCDLCGKMFTQQASLYVHRSIHSKIPRYKCHLCSKTFFYKASLTLHIKRHIGERNHKCHICDKTFLDEKYLRRHEVIHSEEKPFSCNLCGATFKLKKYLHQHCKTHKKC